MDRETDVPPSETAPAEGLGTPARRPWHAPQFMMTEIALTDFMSGGGIDAGSFAS